MTTERLRDLLEERVADVQVVESPATAWAIAAKVRRRRQLAVIGGGAALVLVVTGGSVLFQERRATDTPAGPTPSPTRPTTTLPEPTSTEQGPRAERTGTYRGAPVWWTPNTFYDDQLPLLEVPALPTELSMAQAAAVATPPARIDAIFAIGKQQYRLLSEGRLVAVDLSDHLGPVADVQGNERTPLARDSLSPDGERLFFVQQDGLEVWDLAANDWEHLAMGVTSAEQARWTAGGELWWPGQPSPAWPDPWPHDHAYTEVVLGDGVAAESDWLGRTGANTFPSTPGRIANPHILVAGPVDAPQVLAMDAEGRSVLCCPVVGWVGSDVVLFESHADRWRILAWRVGTADLYRVSEAVDLQTFSVSASYVDAFSAAGR